jgi:hypothetical protein
MNAATDEACSLAIAFARNCNYAVFPVGEDKRPTLKRWPGRASKDAGTIVALWREHPGSLIGIAAGEKSGISVLDIDRKLAASVEWWRRNYTKLLPTRVYETRSGGLHLFYLHADGVRNTQSKVCTGIDTRGEGGFIIAWYAAGFRCFDHSPPAPWPAWLLEELTRAPPRPGRPSYTRPPDNARMLAGIVRRLAIAAEGERNGVLFWAACRCVERGLRRGEIENLLIPIATSIGLPEIEVRGTISSATRRAVA